MATPTLDEKIAAVLEAARRVVATAHQRLGGIRHEETSYVAAIASLENRLTDLEASRPTPGADSEYAYFMETMNSPAGPTDTLLRGQELLRTLTQREASVASVEERPKEFVLAPLFGEPLPDDEWLAALRAYAKPLRDDENGLVSIYTHALVKRFVATLDAAARGTKEAEATIRSLKIDWQNATRRAEAAEAGAHYGYLNEPCVICGESCSSLAGNPAQWPVRLGNDGWRHIGCVNKLLAEREALEAEVGRLTNIAARETTFCPDCKRSVWIGDAASPADDDHKPECEVVGAEKMRERAAQAVIAMPPGRPSAGADDYDDWTLEDVAETIRALPLPGEE